MPDLSLPTGALRAPRPPRSGRGFQGRGRGRVRQLVAHDITGKERSEDVVTAESREKTFSDLLLSPAVLQGLTNSGFLQPSPVQLQAIPPAKIGFDCIVQSKSGTGKTCVYVVTALEMVRPEVGSLQVVVLAPTREIAVQGVSVAQQVGQQMPEVKVQAFIGGLSLAEDKIRAKNCHICVGTPGRVKQLISEGLLSVESVRLAVLDEADKMLESSFITDTTWILNSLPQSKQVLALSATYPESLAALAERFMRSPTHIRPGQASQVLSGVAQLVLPVSHSPAQQRQNSIKQTALLSLLSSLPYTQCLVFSNYTSIAQATADFLNSRGFPAVYMSAGQDQARRLAVMETFKQFNCRILCSTDLTARGIDAENVNLVINLEVPWEHNTYLHRIGRGGRFGSNSLAVTLASEGTELTRLKGIIGKTDSQVRVMDGEEIPSNIRKHLDSLPILSPAVDAEKPVKVEEVGESSTTPKLGGKIKRRGKKKNNRSSDLNETKTSVPEEATLSKEKELEEDQRLVRSYLEAQASNQLRPVRSWEEICKIADRIERQESLEGLVRVEAEGEDKETRERFNLAVERVAAHHRELYDGQLEAVRQTTAGLSAKDIIQLMESDSVLPSQKIKNDAPSQNDFTETPSMDDITDTKDIPIEETESSNSSSQTSSTESDRSETESESDSGSDSEGSSSESESEGSSSDEEAEPGQSGREPNILLWYQQWYSGLLNQRQAIQTTEYYRYLQYYGYHQ